MAFPSKATSVPIDAAQAIAPAWSQTRIVAQLEMAAMTLRSLPDGLLPSAAGRWPPIVRALYEALRDAGRPAGDAPSPESIARLDEVMGWLQWLSADEQRLVWLRAEGLRWKPISERLGIGRTSAWHLWTRALAKIEARLEAIVRTNPCEQLSTIHDDQLRVLNIEDQYLDDQQRVKGTGAVMIAPKER